ncbi:MAG TPA: hypothetical protein PLB16_07100 [bacterium]|nr:hypothetical protein [bacterium]
MKLSNRNDLKTEIKNVNINQPKLITVTEIVRISVGNLENMFEAQINSNVEELNFIDVAEDSSSEEIKNNDEDPCLEENPYEKEGLKNLNPPDITFFEENDTDFDPEDNSKDDPEKILMTNLKNAQEDLSEEEFNVAYAMIVDLDEKGFFVTGGDDFVETLEVLHNIKTDTDTVENVRNFIMELDPIGCGSRTQIEHLVHQFIKLNGIDDNDLKHKLLKNLNKNNMVDVINNYKILTDAGVENVYSELFSTFFKNSDNKRIITPYPYFTFNNIDTYRKTNNRISSRSAETEIHVDENEISITVNSEIYRKFRINEKKYEEMLKKAEQIRDENLRRAEIKQIKEIYQKNREMIDGLNERKTRLRKILEVIAEKHRNHFISRFQEKMAPLTQHEIHEITKISIPSVSNTINEKYVKIFFDGEVAGTFGFDHFITGADTLNVGKSQDEVINMICKIIEKEDGSKPLSDEEISKILAKNKIPIARKTVQKYREKAGIENSSKRRIR